MEIIFNLSFPRRRESSCRILNLDSRMHGNDIENLSFHEGGVISNIVIPAKAGSF
jgi:hypothetical protein